MEYIVLIDISKPDIPSISAISITAFLIVVGMAHGGTSFLTFEPRMEIEAL